MGSFKHYHPHIHGTSFCCMSVLKTYLYEAYCKAVSEGCLKMAMMLKLYFCSTVLNVMEICNDYIIFFLVDTGDGNGEFMYTTT